jgi:hypothetical protein
MDKIATPENGLRLFRVDVVTPNQRWQVVTLAQASGLIEISGAISGGGFRNVSIVANYIKDRTKNAQFIIIFLRFVGALLNAARDT